MRVPRRSVVRRAVDGDALALGHRADEQPALGQRHVGGEGRQQAWSSPPASTNWIGSAPSADPTAWSGSAISNAAVVRRSRPRTPRPGGPGRRAARRRRRSSRWRRRGAAPRRVRRLGTAVGLDQHPRASGSPRPSTASPPAAQPWRPAQSPARRRARRPTAAPGALGTEPSTVTATTTSSAEVRSPPTTRRPDQRALLGEALGEVERPRPPAGPRGAARPTVSECARPPIALMSERFGGRGPVPDVGRRGPVAAEVPVLDEQVGGDHDVAVADAQHGGVVAGPDAAPARPAGTARRAPRSARTHRRPPGSRSAGKVMASIPPDSPHVGPPGSCRGTPCTIG